MRLLRCHIENFGVLSGFDFTFAPGLNSICRDNGFGKSTLAAFIKAMLYGFPRTGSRNIVENERKRYDPWQGGSYGGFLEFETEGISYRVTRYFGKTAAKDSFSLMDLTHRQLSDRFTEKLGEELFQLDADAFARSTYMSQASFRDTEITTSIRTKLSHLVEDTNDLNNCDTAEKRLREYRTRYRAYRGDGGRIHELENNFHNLETAKYEAEQQKPHFQELTDSIAKLDEKISENKSRVAKLREKIQQASTAEAQNAHRRQLTKLQNSVAEEESILKKLECRYPAGCPTLEEIRTQRKNLVLMQKEFTAEVPAEAAETAPAQSSLLMKLFGAGGVLFLLSALFCLFSGKLVPGISFAIVGLLMLLAALWLHVSAVQRQLLMSRDGRSGTAKENAAAARKKAAEDELEQFLERYRLPGDTPENLLDQAEDDCYKRSEAEKRLTVAKRELSILLRENPQLKSDPTEQATAQPDLRQLQAAEKQLHDSLDAMQEKRGALQQDREKLRRLVEKIPEWEDEMARIQTALQEDRRRCTLADHTLELLQQAKANLSGSYVGKIEAGFRKYAKLLLDDRIGDAILDKDLRLHIDEKGAAREQGSFSAGTVDGIALCMRLSLIEALSDREKPFLILDDPFVNFDDTRLHRALEMLHQLAKEQQILYLCCNSSRQA